VMGEGDGGGEPQQYGGRREGFLHGGPPKGERLDIRQDLAGSTGPPFA
jgi:hypothetical protein